MLPKNFSSKVLKVVQLGLQGKPGTAFRAIADRMHGDVVSFGLRRNLDVEFVPPAAKVVIEVRPLKPDDNLAFLSEDNGGSDEYLTRLGQRSLLQTGLTTCYVATVPNGEIAYMQWLIPATEGERLKAHFGDLFPRLAAHEALLEGAFTAPACRGLGIMASAMAQIAAKARQFGARSVITFVDEANVPSLKGCERAGFAPYILRRESWRLLQRRVEFLPLPDTLTAAS